MECHLDECKKNLIDEFADRGPNCCQLTCMAYAEEFQIDLQELLRVAAPFGGGMGYFGLTCGALAGAGIIFSNHFGSDFMDNSEYKLQFYAAVKELCEEFEALSGAATCAAFKKMQNAGHGPTCRELIYLGAEIAQRYVQKYQEKFPDRLAK